MRTSVRARRHERGFLAGHMKARAQVNVQHHTKGALARAREQVNKKAARGRLLAHVCLHTKARARDDQAKFHLYTKGALARDQLQAKSQLYTKGALARDQVDVRPHSREDLGWGHSHFSVGDFGLQSDPQLGTWWQQ